MSTNTPPRRSNKTNRQAGTKFERLIANALANSLNDPRIDRQVKTGARDRGDIANIYIAPLGATQTAPPWQFQPHGGATHVTNRQPRTDSPDRVPPTPEDQQGGQLVIECKDLSGKHPTPKHLREAETERVNAGALACCVVSKRAGITSPMDQLVTMKLRDLAAILTGRRPTRQPRPD